MEMYRRRYSLRILCLAVGLCGILLWALRISRDSQPAYLYGDRLSRGSDASRLLAAEELGGLGAEAVVSIPTLARALLSDPAALVRKRSADSLVRIVKIITEQRPRAIAVAALRQALNDQDTTVRAAAARSLGLIGPEPESVLPSLIRVAGDEDEWVRGAAITALGLIQNKAGVDQTQVRRVLIDAINDGSFHVREMGIYAFWATAEKSPGLSIALLKDPDVHARRSAVIALARSSLVAAGAIPELTEALTDKDRVVRLTAAHALGNLGTPSPTIIRALTRALSDQDKDVREAATRALAAINEFIIPPEES